MSCSQLLTLLGGLAQIAALVLAWVALRRYFKARFPDAEKLALERTVTLLGEQLERVRYWLTLIPLHEPQSLSGTVTATSAAAGNVTLGGEGRIDVVGEVGNLTENERLNKLETAAKEYAAQLRRIGDQQTAEMQGLRHALQAEVAALEARRDDAQSKADAAEERHVRSGLGLPAFLGGLGIFLQICAAFACTHGVCFG